MNTRGLAGVSSIIISLAFGYGGLVQLLAGMWYVFQVPFLEGSSLIMTFYREMAVGNTFGATALSSYGGFWIAFGVLLTPGGFAIEETTVSAAGVGAFLDEVGFFLMVCQMFSLVSTC